MPVTIYDVAEVAGVGISTVSRVLNDSVNVRPTTRQKVLSAIDVLGYKPNLMARNLSRPHTQSVGVLLSYLTNPFQVAILQGIEQALSQAGYDLIIFNLDSQERRQSVLENLSEGRRTDGLIVVSFGLDDRIHERFQRYNIPLVAVDYFDKELPSIFVDNIHGGYLATQYLVDAGHRRIGYIQDYADPPNGPGGNWPGLDRYQGYLKALDEAGIANDTSLVEYGQGHTRKGGRHAAKALLDHAEPPTAIFAASDMLALGVLEYARSQDTNVPNDLTVIGFDDIEVASFAGLTTVRQPVRRMGHEAADIIMALMKGKRVQQIHRKMPLRLVVRESSRSLLSLS